MAAGFAWDLSTLSTGDALEKAIEAREKRLRVHTPSPTPLGGAIDDAPRAVETIEEETVSLAVSWMMAIKAGCFAPSRQDFYVVGWGTRILYMISFVLCFGTGVATLVETHWYNLQHMDWFGWTVFGVLAVSELLFIVIRIVDRWAFVGKPNEVEGTIITADIFIRRSTFKSYQQATFVIAANTVGSIIFLFGLLTMHMQMMLSASNPDPQVHTVGVEWRETWTHMWTVAYSFVAVGLSTAALMDPSRVGELDSVTGWGLEFLAWRVLLLVMVAPIICPAFAVYVNVCCEGDWYTLEGDWVSA